jgi:eukaryotic-like serine/threonine-protein kinase
MPLSTGTRLGPYEIIALIGRGGMGEVYRARDTRLDRMVAIKVLPPGLSGEGRRRERLEREARAISSLNHPRICTLYDVGRHESIEYLVMELLEGQTLAERLLKGRLPLDQALAYAIQIADALEYAHRHGIIHRDLKPANIMLTTSGAKVLDFGIAKAADPEIAATATAQSTLTEEGTRLGTVQYMAPEQIEGRAADARSDLFAFGGVLYEMLTGQPAFTGESQSKIMAAVLDSEPPTIAATQPMTPPALEHLVTTCLAKNPDDRWQNAGDIKRQLGWIAEGTRSTVTPPTGIGAGTRLWRNAAIVASLVALVFGSALAWTVETAWRACPARSPSGNLDPSVRPAVVVFDFPRRPHRRVRRRVGRPSRIVGACAE